jgi:hypothetical protein
MVRKLSGIVRCRQRLAVGVFFMILAACSGRVTQIAPMQSTPNPGACYPGADLAKRLRLGARARSRRRLWNHRNPWGREYGINAPIMMIIAHAM